MSSGSTQWRVYPDEARRQAAGDSATDPCVLLWAELAARCAGEPSPSTQGAVWIESWVDALSAETPGGAALLRQIAHAGLSEEQLGQGLASLPEGLRKRAASVARRYAAWRSLRREADVSSIERMERAEQQLAGQGLPAALRSASELWVLLDRSLSPVETAFLLALAQACEVAQLRLRLTLAASGVPAVDVGLETLFGALERKAQTLNFVELERGVGPGPDSVEAGAWMEGAAETLESAETRFVPPTDLALVCARSPSEECEEVARRVQRLLSQGATQIAVALFDESPEETRRFQAALARRGIPVQAESARLHMTAPARRALELLAVAERGYPVARVAPLLPSPPDAPAASTLLVEAGVRDAAWGATDGKDGYTVRLQSLEQRLLGSGKRERAQAVAALRVQWNALHDELESLPREGLLSDLWPRVLALFQRWAFRRGELATTADSLTLASQALQGNALWSRRANRAQLARALTWAWEQLPVAGEDTPGSVWLVRARGLAGRSFQHLFLVGLESDRWPRPWSPPSPLPEEAQRELNRWARRPLFAILSPDAFDRLSWVQALGSARASLTLSFAQTGWNGDRKEPSEWLRGLAVATALPLPEPLPRFTLTGAETEAELRLAAARVLAADAPPGAVAGEAISAAAVEVVLGHEPWLREARERARMERERLAFFSRPDAVPGAFSGQVPAGASLRSALAYGADHPLSASALGRWGNCAYQGWLTGLLRVEARDPLAEDMGPRVQGIFWHAVLEQLVSRLPAGVAQLSPGVLEPLLDQTLDEVTRSLSARGMACHPALWKLAQESARQMVHRLVQSDGLFPFGARPIRRTEVAFGTARSEEAWRSVALPAEPGELPVHFEGKIDRLDASPEALAVMDYKSASPKSDGQVVKELLETQFQLPLYLYAARRAGFPGALSAAWISLKTGEVRELGPALQKAGQTVEGLLSTDAQARAEAVERGVPNLANAVHALLTPLRQGQFPIRSRDCFGCGLEAVCRITSRRAEEPS